MKAKDLHFYEIGMQWFGPQLYDFPEEKRINISHFKKGFGGFPVTVFMGEKYYDKDYFLKIYGERVTKLAESIK